MLTLPCLFFKRGGGRDKSQEMFHTFPGGAQRGPGRAAGVIQDSWLGTVGQTTQLSCVPRVLQELQWRTARALLAVLGALSKRSAVGSLKEPILPTIGNLRGR